MKVLTKEDELRGYTPDTFSFWRNIAMYFCIFSVVGHWLEIAYCLFMNLFGIVDADSLVWDDPFYPFLVYGIGTVVCSLVLVPIKVALLKHNTSRRALVVFFIITVLVCMLMELAMGFMLNRPDPTGEYPLWDNSDLPLNILGQAWLVNDIVLGAVALFYTWLIYPLCNKAIAKLHPFVANALAVMILIGFVALCIVKFSV